MRIDRLTVIILIWVALVLWAAFNVLSPDFNFGADFDQFIVNINEPFEFKVWHSLLFYLWLIFGRDKK